MEVTANRDRVAALADGADPLSLPNPLAPPDQRRPRQMRVEVAAVLAFAVEQQEVAIEDRVVADPQDPTVGDRDQRGAAGGNDVEALVGAAAVAVGTEFADAAPDAVRAPDREDVAVVGNGPDRARDPRRGRRGQSEEKD
jgi:hypothetical protein